jgi:Putative Flp pilus-assembly TadE/G-like
MACASTIKSARAGGALRFLRRFAANTRGNIAVMSALVLPALVGTFGLGTEAVSWYATARSAQNAADSAAIAAASNAGANYATEALAVAARYGFVDGQSGVTVTAVNSQPCPSGAASNCYKVMVSKSLPLLLAGVVGYRGNARLAGAPAQKVTATSVALQGTSPRPYCVLALASSGTTPALRTNGAPKADLAGCNVMSNTSSVCNGHNLNADHGDAHATDGGCGVIQTDNVATVPDPYAGLVGSVPANACGAYPQEPTKKNQPALPPENLLAGPQAWSGTVQICGDVQLTGPVTVNTDSNGAVLVIQNGQLDTNGFTLQTSNGSALTVIFSGTAGAYTHAPTGGGTIDIAAPTKGTWSGVAIYQDPRLTEGLDLSAAGNSPTWDITGLVYLPHASVTFSGAVNKASNGKSCFVLVADNLLVNGTGNILAHGECPQAGLGMPSSTQPSRGLLVL